MMQVSVSCRDLEDQTLQRLSQLGVDCLDFGDGAFFPGVAETGVPDATALRQILGRLAAHGLRINRVTLPDLTEAFMGEQEDDTSLEAVVTAVKIYADAGVPILRQRLLGDTFNHLITFYKPLHRGGYRTSGGSLWHGGGRPVARSAEEKQRTRFGIWPDFGVDDPPSLQQMERWWGRFRRAFDALVPAAQMAGCRLAVHPSDIPLPGTPFGTLGFHRVIDQYPGPTVGLLYCCGTRAEAGGQSLVLEELANYGRRGRILMVHLRNVRGSLATSGGFEEALLDDGDMNMFRLVQALDDVGFTGCLNPDHVFPVLGDGADAKQGFAYSVGYIKALLAALAVRRPL